MFMIDEQNFLKNLGKKIKKSRKDKGFTQEQIALDTSIDRAYISEIENGHKNPSIFTLKKISIALGVTMADIIG